MKSELYVELNGGRDNRRATRTEAVQAMNLKRDLDLVERQIKSLKKQRDALRKTCEHKVFFDEAGYEYDCRVCAACGAGLGFI